MDHPKKETCAFSTSTYSNLCHVDKTIDCNLSIIMKVRWLLLFFINSVVSAIVQFERHSKMGWRDPCIICSIIEYQGLLLLKVKTIMKFEISRMQVHS